MADEKRLIDADALISRFCELANRVTATDNWFHLDAITDEIMDAPTVDAVEVVHGKWLTWGEKFPKTKLIGVESLGVFCSVCEMHADNKTRYCPNCGAKMDGGNEDG